MAEQKSSLEREYVIPLRKAWLKAPRYERMRIAIRTIRRFLARHMKIPDRDLKKVKLDIFFNNELWFRGAKKPPAKVKVRAIKEGSLVKVNFIQMPEHVKFLKQKLEKRYKLAETKVEKPEEKEEKPEEKKIDEKEKAQATAEQRVKEAEQQAKAQKHLTKAKETGFHRMALKK